MAEKPLKKEVLELLRRASDSAHPLSRRRLCMETGLRDRSIRKVITLLQREHVVLGSPDGGYYYVQHTAADEQAAFRYISAEYKRSRSQTNKVSRLYHNFKKKFNVRIRIMEEQPELY